jgi:ATP-dependent RNA helicase DBP3
MSPTRELAMQIYDVVNIVCGHTHLKTVCVYGGVPQWKQVKELTDGCHFLICTPGRLFGMLQESVIDLSKVSFFILDEADRMLDMGFIPTIRNIHSHIAAKRQTMLFSATWPPEVQKLSEEFAPVPVIVSIKQNEDGEARANVRVKQTVEVMEPHLRDRRLLNLLAQHHKSRTNRIIVFAVRSATVHVTWFSFFFVFTWYKPHAQSFVNTLLIRNAHTPTYTYAYASIN